MIEVSNAADVVYADLQAQINRSNNVRQLNEDQIQQVIKEIGIIRDGHKILISKTGTIMVYLDPFTVSTEANQFGDAASVEYKNVKLTLTFRSVGNRRFCWKYFSPQAHPHVSGTAICYGDQTMVAETESEKCSILNTFQITKNVLENYNYHSHYTALQQLAGYSRCHYCDKYHERAENCVRHPNYVSPTTQTEPEPEIQNTSSTPSIFGAA